MATIFDEIFGQRPDVAKWKFNLGDTISQGIQGNIGNFDEISQLGKMYQDFLVGQQEELLPGYKDTLAEGQKGAQQLLTQGEQLLGGEIPQDVRDAIQRDSAYTSFSGGFGGSQMAHGLTARDLGLTSLDLMKQGASMIGQGGNSAQQWASLAGRDIMDPASMFVSPTNYAQLGMTSAENKYNAQQYGYNVEAAPNPVAAGLFNVGMGLFGQANAGISSYANSRGGGGGGGL